MHQGGELVTVVAVDPANLADPAFALALALLTIGCQLDAKVNGGEVCEFREMIGGKPQRRFEFVFDVKVKVDGVDVSEWKRRWSDDAWRAANPGHFFAFLRKASENLTAFAAWMKAHVAINVFREIDSGGEPRKERVAYVPENLTGTERGNEILRRAGIRQ